MEAKELLMPNPLLYSVKEKYIWISDLFIEYRKAQTLFTYLLIKGIYINGFATETKSLVGLKMYNKEIFDRSRLVPENAIVFYDMWFHYTEGDQGDLSDKGELARVINPDVMGAGKIVIWGSGITGENAYKILTHHGLHVKFFVDANEALEGGVKDGLPIYSPDRLEEMGDGITIIEAMEKWKTVDDRIGERYSSRFYHRLYSVSNDITCCVDDIERKVFSLAYFWVFHRFSGKKIYIYGNGSVEREFAGYLKLLDCCFAGFLIDENDAENEDVQESVAKQVEEIIYEDNYYIWVNEKKKVEKLKELGLRYFSEYECNGYIWDITMGKEQLDVNLGHNYLADSKYPGVMVYGEEKEGDYKMAVLGSSTTDGAMYPFKSWSQILYEKLGKKGITVYNGGVRGYTSGQELIKLIRDILPLKPNMVVVYDGASELYGKKRYPFAFEYARKVYEYANEHIEDNYIVDNTENICLGIENNENYFDNWLSNMQCMYAITQQRGIKFFVFCQPWLMSKEGKTDKEKNIMLSMPAATLENMIENVFTSCIRKRTNLPDYIHDLTYVYDGKDVYMDLCHVWEEGNQIIAEEIKKVILPELKSKGV